jgi:hypothetical protein
MSGLKFPGIDAFSTPMAVMADNEATERMPDNERAEAPRISSVTKAPLRAGEGSLLDVEA